MPRRAADDARVRLARRARRRPRLPQGPRAARRHGLRRQRRRLPARLSRASSHYHDTQDELYFVHSGTAKVEVEGEERILGPGGLFHVESTTPRRISNAGDDELVLLVIGGKDGYVERDGHVMSDEDLELRMNLGKEQS